MKRVVITVLVLVVISGLIYGVVLMFRTSEETTETEVITVEDNLPDIRIQGAQLLAYSVNGDVLFKAQAHSIEHSTNSDVVSLQDLELDISLDDGASWNLAANSGEIVGITGTKESSRDQRVELIGNVSLASTNRKQSALSIQSHQLTYYPNSRILSSQHPATISNNSATIQAGAFDFDLKSNEIHLKSNEFNRVEIIYETPSTD